ncbi:MAG: ATP-binding cassette domain-containing protein [Acidimicrobiia bacterium]|nr:ATP-binding cassette domain-containing protein [Acidimicrobiia bacterium]
MSTSNQNTADPVIAARNLRKSFGDVEAVKDLSFSVAPGQVVGLLGPNGAGKTTTVNMLATLTSIDDGSASIGGFDVATQPDLVRQLIGLAGQAAAVDEKLTARENLELFGRLYKLPSSERKQRADELIEQFDMADFADRVAGTHSGGQRRRLDVVAALVADPPALFLDEPTTGLDPRSRAELWDAIGKLAAGGTAIVLTTQYLEEADHLADEVLIIDKGTVIASGTPETLKRSLEGDVLEIHVDEGEMPGALELIGPVDGLVSDEEARQIGVPVGDDVARSLEILRRLEDGGISISDFQLRRPTLDDVFLNLTGAPTEKAEVPA